MNNTPAYQTLENRPVACNFCGAFVTGRITEQKNAKTNETIKECRWICGRCGNLTKIGNVK